MIKKIISKLKYLIRSLIVPARSVLTRVIKSKSKYFLFPTDIRRQLEPLSRKHGYDRGTPIDRYYIEKFLEKNKNHIHSHCLEIHDNAYTKRFGADRVTKSDVLDIDTANGLANIYGDLRNLINVSDNTYDSIILTHTIGSIDDVWSVIKECHRILKPGGSVLITASTGIKPHRNPENSFWRFSVGSYKYLLGKYFDLEKVAIKTYGNVLVCQAFLVGVALEELKPEELEYNDIHFPLIITAVAQK